MDHDVAVKGDVSVSHETTFDPEHDTLKEVFATDDLE
jgi:hypothetical protein